MIPYMGGKSYLARWIIDHFPENYQNMTYIEPFGGGGWVLFKKEQSDVEVYNDLNSHLVNLFNVIKNNFEEFKHRAEWTLHSKEMFLDARQKLQDDEFLNEVEKAIEYATYQIQRFGGTSTTWGYSITASKLYSGKWRPFVARLEAVNARLKRVQLECSDFMEIIEKYDTENSLFYIDPPYVDKEGYYDSKDVKFTTEDHTRLAVALNSIKGKFVLSYYDHPLVRQLYANCRIIEKQTTKHSCGITRNYKKKRPKGIELLIMNY